MRSGSHLAIGSLLVAAASLSACGLGMGDTGLACQDPPTEEEILGQREVPDVVGLTPPAAAEAIAEAGITPSWRYSYETDPESRQAGYSECWCIPPPDGAVVDVIAEPDEQPIVFVARASGIIGGRAQPTQGWGCPEPA